MVTKNCFRLMTTPYEIKLYRYTPEVQKASEISRIDSLFTKIENRYWAWKKKKQESGIKEFTSRQIMSKEDAEAFFVGQRESDQKALIRIFEELNAHYIRLFCYVQEFNNIELRKAIAKDKREYKEFNNGLKTANRIDFYIASITIRYGVKHKSTLGGTNGYIIKDIYERLKLHKDIFPISSISLGEDGFETIRSIIREEVSKHIFEVHHHAKSDLQPLAERCSDLYSEFMKHKEWIFNGDKDKLVWSYPWLAGEKIVDLLGLKFEDDESERKGKRKNKIKADDIFHNNKKCTFINALHPIHELKEHSLSDIIHIELS